MKKFVAERQLIAERVADGIRRNVVIRIGAPYWIEMGELAGCSVEFEGLPLSLSDRKGIDLLQALQIASDVNVFLATLTGEFNFFWLTGDPYTVDA